MFLRKTFYPLLSTEMPCIRRALHSTLWHTAMQRYFTISALQRYMTNFELSRRKHFVKQTIA